MTYYIEPTVRSSIFYFVGTTSLFIKNLEYQTLKDYLTVRGNAINSDGFDLYKLKF